MWMVSLLENSRAKMENIRERFPFVLLNDVAYTGHLKGKIFEDQVTLFLISRAN